MLLTTEIEFVGTIELEELSKGPVGPDSERFRGRTASGEFFVTVGHLGPALTVSLGEQFEHLVCNEVVEVSLVGFDWTVMVKEPNSETMSIVVRTGSTDVDGRAERLSAGVAETTEGLRVAIDVLVGLRVGANRTPVLDCDLAEAVAGLTAAGFEL